MSSFKKLSKSDVTVVPYHANKQWNLSYCPYPTSSTYLTIYKGTNIVNSVFSTENDPVTEGQYERLVYSQINQLYYQDYTASLNTHSLANSIYYESASVQRPTSSYFIYNDSANLISNFPTGSNEGIRVLSVNQDIYGNKLLPHNFILTSSAYNVSDDGYGNLYDVSTHIGNIFYAQGIIVITNQDYQLMFPLPPLAVNDTAYFLTATSPKIVYPLSNDSGRGGTLLTSSLSLSGSASELSYWTNNGDGTITLTTSLTGSYIAYYTVEASYSCGNIVSNKAKVTAIVAPVIPPTTTTTTSTTTTTTTPPPTTTTTTTTTSTTSTTTTPPPTTTTTTSTTTTTTTPEPTTTTTTTSTTTTTTTEAIATFDGDFTLCVASGSTEDFRAQDNSSVGGHFTQTATITQNTCSGPVNVTGSLTSGQGPLKIAIPSVPTGATAIVVAQGIGATNATITSGSVGSVFELIITPNSYPTTVILSGTLTVTY